MPNMFAPAAAGALNGFANDAVAAPPPPKGFAPGAPNGLDGLDPLALPPPNKFTPDGPPNGLGAIGAAPELGAANGFGTELTAPAPLPALNENKGFGAVVAAPKLNPPPLAAGGGASVAGVTTTGAALAPNENGAGAFVSTGFAALNVNGADAGDAVATTGAPNKPPLEVIGAAAAAEAVPELPNENGTFVSEAPKVKLAGFVANGACASTFAACGTPNPKADAAGGSTSAFPFFVSIGFTKAEPPKANAGFDSKFVAGSKVLNGAGVVVVVVVVVPNVKVPKGFGLSSSFGFVEAKKLSKPLPPVVVAASVGVGEGVCSDAIAAGAEPKENDGGLEAAAATIGAAAAREGVDPPNVNFAVDGFTSPTSLPMLGPSGTRKLNVGFGASIESDFFASVGLTTDVKNGFCLITAAADGVDVVPNENPTCAVLSKDSSTFFIAGIPNANGEGAAAVEVGANGLGAAAFVARPPPFSSSSIAFRTFS